MRSLVKILATSTAVLVVSAVGASADMPLNGTYRSNDLGGPLYTGHYSESWTVTNGYASVGNVIQGQSWDGAALGTQWKYWCPQVTIPPTLIIDTVNPSGYGQRTYMATYGGGYFYLSGSGPWANGDPQYTGTLDQYTEFITYQYADWQVVGAVMNVQASGHFDGYPQSCVSFGISNGAWIGSTDLGPEPPEYPPFLDTSCGAARTMGSWWNLTQLTLTVTGCALDGDEASWGRIKTLYEE
jgi:hypothetical protein